jgi:hypothetical protein
VNLGSQLTLRPALCAGHACPAHPEASVSQDRSPDEYGLVRRLLSPLRPLFPRRTQSSRMARSKARSDPDSPE